MRDRDETAPAHGGGGADTESAPPAIAAEAAPDGMLPAELIVPVEAQARGAEAASLGDATAVPDDVTAGEPWEDGGEGPVAANVHEQGSETTPAAPAVLTQAGAPPHDVAPPADARELTSVGTSAAPVDPLDAVGATSAPAGGPAAVVEEPAVAVVGTAAPAAPVGSDLPSAAETSTGNELEEVALPSSIVTLEPLPAGTVTGPDGSTTVERLIETRGRVNRYLATWTGSGGARPAELIEAPADHAGVQREAEVLSQVRYAMLPEFLGSWEQEGRRYAATARVEGQALEEAFNAGLRQDQVISIGLQLAQALRRLHVAGWALLGLSPQNVYLGQPVRVTRLGTAVRIGEAPATTLHLPGYSAPELAHRAPVTGKEDVYALAAVMYRGLAGAPLPEEGAALADLAAAIHVPGAPQLLAPALAAAEERIDLEGFYQALLGLKRRLALAPLALRVAMGTSIGLNETRLTNEDACGYLTWCSAYEGRVVYNALLCAIDGMGGMEAGEVAATAALRAALHGAAAHSTREVAAAVGSDRDTEGSPSAAGAAGGAPAFPSLNPKDLVQSAAEVAYTAAKGRRVGATITCALIEDGQLRLAHVGDTRAYLLRDGVLTQLTRDHSLVAAMTASGLLTKEEARTHPERNKVLRSLGSQRRLPDDYIDDLTVEYGEPVLQLRHGDQLLLCSDGIWSVLNDAALLRLLTEAPDCETVVATAIRLVLEGGAPDNAAIIVARCLTMPAS